MGAHDANTPIKVFKGSVILTTPDLCGYSRLYVGTRDHEVIKNNFKKLHELHLGILIGLGMGQMA